MHFKLPKTGSLSDEAGIARMEIGDDPMRGGTEPTAIDLSRGKTLMTRQEAVEILSRNKTLLSDFHVNALYLFGSVVRDEDGPESDIDILVEFNQDARVGLFELARLRTFPFGDRGLQRGLGDTGCFASLAEGWDHGGSCPCRVRIGKYAYTICSKPSKPSNVTPRG